MKERDVEVGFVLKLERGEEVVSSIQDFCARRGIRGAVFTGIGAVKNSTIGYYNLDSRDYGWKNFPEDREVASMNGNVALVDDKPFVHVHTVLSATDETLSCIGGHMKSAEVAVTLEIFLTPLPTPLTRVMDDSIGLKLLAL